MFRRLILQRQQHSSFHWKHALAVSAGLSTAVVALSDTSDKRSSFPEASSPNDFSQWSIPSGLSLIQTTQCQMHSMLPSFLVGNDTPKNQLRRTRTQELLDNMSDAETIDSKYEVQWNKPIGTGSFGSVYVGMHRKSGQRVAIKKIPKRYTSSASFQREVQALATIRQSGGHVNICGLRENFSDDDYYYLVIDYVGGGEMFEALCVQGAYSEADAARLIRQVASALSFLHSIGVVHSDLKPENLLLSDKKTDNSSIKLVDFGCAVVKQPDGKNAVAEAGGRGTATTVAYSPPEVLRNKKNPPLEPSFDMWSLGVMVYVMLTGSHPFDLNNRSTDQQMEERIVSGQKPPLDSSLTAHLSRDAIDLMDRLMCWDADKRMTADELLKNPWIQGKTASTKKIPRSEARLSAYRKHKTGVGRHFFRHMIQASTSSSSSSSSSSSNAPMDDGTYTDAAKRNCLLEMAFRQVDKKGRGYVSTKELNGDFSFFGEDAKLTLAEVSDLLSQDSMTNEYFPKGHLVYSEGDPGEYMYFINSGSVDVTSKEGFRKSRGAGEFFGQDALRREDGKYINTIRCETPVHAIRISRENFDKYVKADKQIELTMEETERLRNRERAFSILGSHKNKKAQTFSKGDLIVRKGDQGNTLYLLEEGAVHTSVDGQGVRSLRLGEMIGEHEVFYGHLPYNVTARCVTEKCQMGALSSRDLHATFKGNPSLKESLHDIMVRNDFEKALCVATKRPFPETAQELKAAFAVLDEKQSGEVTLTSLTRLMKQFDPQYADDDIRQMLKSMDLTHSGSVTWNEFKQIFGKA